MGLLDLKRLKCKTCGEPLDLSKAQNGVIICGVCDSRYTVPKNETLPEVRDYLNQGGHDLDTGKFDDAYAAFSKAAELDKTEPEAYWGMALSEHKIQYLKDEVNNRLQPICHEINDKDFADSASFLKALRYATEAQREEYERKGNEINYIKNEFYKIAQSGVKYDCFICVKVSDENGGRTQDYKTADDIYFELKGKGYKPFFSERELGGVTGADYEARILYALYSSECMLVVCFDEAYLRTKWVKNEYFRFLKLVNDEEKESDSIALVFDKKPIEKLHGKNGKIQGIAINSLTAMERIVSFVDNHTPEAKRKREEEQRKREEEEKRKAQEDEALRKKLAEQEERFKQLEEMFKAQQEARKAEEERAKKEAEERAKQEAAAAAAKQASVPKTAHKPAQKATPQPAAENTSFVIEKGVLKQYKGRAKSVGIPEGVAEIANYAFNNSNIISVDISGRVKKLGNYAFNNCNALINATLGNGVSEIGNYAFNNCGSLESVNIPQSVKTVGNYAFYNCNSLKEVSIEGAGRIGNYAFYNCAALKNIVIPDGVSEIGNNAFNIYNLESVTMPARFKGSVKNIFGVDLQNYSGKCKFTFTGEVPSLVDTVKRTVTEGAKRIADEAKRFAEQEKEKARIEKEKREAAQKIAEEEARKKQEAERAEREKAEAEQKALNAELRLKERHYEGWLQQYFLIDNNKQLLKKYKGTLPNLEIPNGIKELGLSAFQSCRLESVTLPESIEIIGQNAFSCCKRLKSVVIPKNVSLIGKGSFAGCTSLENVTFAQGRFLRIDDSAFSGCGALKKLVTCGRVNSIGENAFYNCNGLVQKMMGIHYVDRWVVGSEDFKKPIFVDRPVEIICDGAFFSKRFSDIVLPEGIRHIGKNAFYCNGSLTSIKLPKSLESIGKSAFFNCHALKSIALPKGLKSIGEEAFGCCASLESVKFSAGLVQLGGYAFNKCSRLKEVVIPDGVKRIEWYTFQDCTSLKSVKLPKSVEYIGFGAFNGCTGLKLIVLPSRFYDEIKNHQSARFDEAIIKAVAEKKCKVKFI